MKKLAATFVGLNALDLALTLYFIYHGSFELNPIMVKILALPLPLALAYKILIPTLLITIMVLFSRLPMLRHFGWKRVMWLLVIGQSAICLFNLTGLIVK